MTLPPPDFWYNGSQPFSDVVDEVNALTPAVSRSIDGYAGCPELPSGLGPEESAVGLPKIAIRHRQKRVIKRPSAGRLQSTVADRPAAVIRSVEMPARKVPFTRLMKIVVAELPAADS